MNEGQSPTPEEVPVEPTWADSEHYIKERIKGYQTWYDGKARSCKSRYLWMRGLTVVGGALVPVLVNFDFNAVQYTTTTVSLLVVILVSLESVLHYREQWKNYRSTEQYLGHELVYYETRAGAYRDIDGKQAFLLLVDRVESAIASENAATLNTMTLAQQVTEEQGKGGAS